MSRFNASLPPPPLSHVILLPLLLSSPLLLPSFFPLFLQTSRSKGLNLRLVSGGAKDSWVMEVIVGDTVLGRARHDLRATAGANALQNAISFVRKDISSRAEPKSSSMLHGISIVDRKNMTKTEEELMRQLVHIFGAHGLPQLRAKSNVRGEGWTMQLVVAGKIIGIGRNARRGAAGEAALSSALQSVKGQTIAHVMASATYAEKIVGGDDAAAGPAAAAFTNVTVIGGNNMSGMEKELMDRLRTSCAANGSMAIPQLRAKRNHRGDDGWTMDVVVGDTVLSTAHGKRRCIAGEKALNKAISAYAAFVSAPAHGGGGGGGGGTAHGGSGSVEKKGASKEEAAKKRALGNIRFIGELFKEDLVSSMIMLRCINHLMPNKHAAEENMEILCKLLDTAGGKWEKQMLKAKKNKRMTAESEATVKRTFSTMVDITVRPGLSPRIKRAIRDILDLKGRGWKMQRERTQYPFLESFEGPPPFELHGLGLGDTAHVVNVNGSVHGRWNFWYSGGGDDGLAAACGLFNLLCRQFCRFHQIRKSVDDLCKVSHDDDDDWSVTMDRVTFGKFGGNRPGAQHQGHDLQRPYYRLRGPAQCVSPLMFANLFPFDRFPLTARKEEAARKEAADGGQRLRCAEWHLDDDSGRTTGLKQQEASVVGYHSCVPTELREELPNVRSDNIDADERHAVYT